MSLVPASFKFSLKITTITVSLAIVMVFLSNWQWERYKAKVILVEAYRQNDTADAMAFNTNGREPQDFVNLIDKKVSLSGSYDYTHQLIVTNKKYSTEDFSTQPGHFLMTPLILDGSDTAVMVSRGFIPFTDLTPETWAKYNFEPATDNLTGVLKTSITPMFLGPKNPAVGEGQPFQNKFFYEEVAKMAKQLPYPVITPVFVQRLGAPPSGQYPAPAVSVEVPPSTHKGYTFEWAFLAICSLAIGYILQAFPHYRGTVRSGFKEGWRIVNPLEERSAPD